MKSRILIVEPSEMIVTGLTEILKSLNYRVLEPRRAVDGLSGDLAVLRPDVMIINPTLCPNLAQVLDRRPIRVAALVYQYVEQSLLRQYNAVIDVRDGSNIIEGKLVELCSAAAPTEVRSNASHDLTKRETAVLVEVAKGLTNKEIADALNLSVHTVISHRKNIMHKTGIKSVAGLTVYAMLNNLID